MTHDVLVAEIQVRAQARGLLTHYCGRSVTCSGDRGLPDLVVAGPYGVAWLEVKTGQGQLKPGQVKWKHTLTAGGQLHRTVTAEHLDMGLVDRLLDRLARDDAR